MARREDEKAELVRGVCLELERVKAENKRLRDEAMAWAAAAVRRRRKSNPKRRPIVNGGRVFGRSIGSFVAHISRTSNCEEWKPRFPGRKKFHPLSSYQVGNENVSLKLTLFGYGMIVRNQC